MSACSQSSIWNQWQTEIIDGPKWPQYGIIHTGMSQNLKNELIWNEWTEIVYGILYTVTVRWWVEYSHDPCFIRWDFLESKHLNMDILVSWPLRLLDYLEFQRLYYNQRVRWRCGQYKSAKTIDQWACGILNRLSGFQQAFSFLILALPIYSNYILVNCNFFFKFYFWSFIYYQNKNQWVTKTWIGYKSI